ncbi:MAG: HD domain-containing protein, partial [Deltaproteobacteria bacterium]|nr:HD domain-containing protein [Deltaproteobacteria bacterium]
MEKVFVKEINENDKVESIFLVKQKSISYTKAGNPYLNLTLIDKTGEVNGKVWEQAEKLAKLFQKDDFVKIKSTAVTYQNSLQLNISSIIPLSPSEIDITNFLPQAKNDIEQTFLKLKAIIEEVSNAHLKKLLDLFIADDQLIRLFKLAPAAKKMHHVYLGGLLEHTLSLSNLILQISKHYEGLNVDLLLTGGILHDIGKIHELTYSRSFDYSDSGRLIGHITLGVEMINEKIRLIPDFPQELAVELRHLIISHHGEYQYGSPKRPKTLEAFILYYLDDLDAKVEEIQSFIQREEENQSKCAGYHQMLERFI